MGMYQAGAEHITGVDIEYQPEYPGNDLFHAAEFDFIQSDFCHIDPDWMQDFDFIWASPPCQAYSYAGHRWRNAGKKYDDLVNKTRRLLHWSGVPFVIENVPGAPIRKDLTLCGEMFGLKVIRHRIFEIEGFDCAQPEHVKHRGMVKDKYYVTVAGNGGDYAGHNFCKLNDLPGANQLKTWQYAMDISWITKKKTLRESVPPPYSKYIFEQFLQSHSETSSLTSVPAMI